jgi:hypothetical protein
VPRLAKLKLRRSSPAEPERLCASLEGPPPGEAKASPVLTGRAGEVLCSLYVKATPAYRGEAQARQDWF